MSEHFTPAPTELAPDRTGVWLAYDSYDTVAAAFSDFTPPPANGYGTITDRGGHVRDKEPRSTKPSIDHVEASFTEGQKRYIDITSAALNMIARGRVPTDRECQLPTLGQRIVDNFFRQEPHLASFDLSVSRSILEIYGAFIQLYPNLLPALAALNTVGGAEGTTVAFNNVRGRLPEALNPELARPNTLLGSMATRTRFTGTHRGKEVPHEVWCPGQAFALTIIRQAAAAASELAAKSVVKDMYKPTNDDARLSVDNLGKRISDLINDAAYRAAAQHGQGQTVEILAP